MPDAPALANDATGGRVEPVRLALRSGEAGSGGPLAAEEAARAGGGSWSAALGSFEVRVGVERAGETRTRLVPQVRNAGSVPQRLGSLVLGFVWRAPPTRSLRYLRNGWQSWSDTGSRALDDDGTPGFPSGPWLRGLHHAQPEPPADRAGWHESHGVLVVGGSPDGPACLVGACEDGRSFAVAWARRAGTDVRLELELCVDAVLEAGEERALEAVDVALGDDAWALLERFGEAHGRAAGARTWRPFPTGWCSWYHAFHDVDEAGVLRALEALTAVRDEIPVEVVQLDDGFQRATGDWLEANAKFPRGLPALAADVRAAGFVPGLWTAPFCAVTESGLFQKHPDWFLTEGGAPRVAFFHPQWAADGRVFGLDPTRDEVVRHLEELFGALVAQGFLYLKLDFLFAAVHGEASAPAVGPAARLRRGLEAVRRGAGEEAFLLGCGCPLGAAVGVVDGMRIGPDVAPRWDPDPAARVPGLEPTLPAASGAVRSALARAWMHRRLWINDPDCLLARSRETQLSADERHALAAAIAGTGGMLVASDDPARLLPGDRDLLRDALVWARAVDAAGIPGAVRVDGVLEHDTPRRAVLRDAEGVTMALVNAGDAPARIAFPDLPAGAREPARVLGDGAVPDAEGRVALAPHAGSLWRVERDVPLAVFCDFDGTFSVQDVGATLAQRFAPERRPAQWDRYLRGEITPWEYNLEILDGLPVGVPQLEAFLATVDLDPGAAELVDWCEGRGVPFRILSDGFDWNLNRLQSLHGVRFAYTANALRVEGGRWRIRAGSPDTGACGCGTGICKGGVMRAWRATRPGARLVHIGNGRVSDTCGALEADLAFAKDSLAEELAGRGEPFVRFETLHDVIPHLAEALGGPAPVR